MQRMASRRVGFSPDISEEPMVSRRSNVGARAIANAGMRPRGHKQAPARSVASSPVRLFNFVKSNVVRAIRSVSMRRRRPPAKGTSNVVVPQQFVPHRDSHHSEALEDCIEFINSSSF